MLKENKIKEGTTVFIFPILSGSQPTNNLINSTDTAYQIKKTSYCLISSFKEKTGRKLRVGIKPDPANIKVIAGMIIPGLLIIFITFELLMVLPSSSLVRALLILKIKGNAKSPITEINMKK